MTAQIGMRFKIKNIHLSISDVVLILTYVVASYPGIPVFFNIAHKNLCATLKSMGIKIACNVEKHGNA